MATFRFRCESGHKGMISRMIARCPICDAPAHLSSEFRAIGVNEEDWAKLARMCDAIPNLADVFVTIMQAINNYAAVEGVSIEDLSPSTMVSPTGVIVLDLITPAPAEEEAA